MERKGFRLAYGNAKLVGLALILMISGSFVVILGPRPHFYSPPEPIRQTHSINYNVTSEEPEWNYTIRRSDFFGNLDQIGITDMDTNGTPVGIVIQNLNNVTLLALSGVSRIADSSLVVQGSDYYDFKIIVTRESGNANGSLVILIWLIPPPPAIDPIMLITPFLITLIFSMIIFWMIAKTKTSRRSIRPFGVAILVLLSLALVSPYIIGSLGGFFTPRDLTEHVFFERRTLVLNASHPDSLFPFGSEVQDDAESFRIHSFEDDERYHFELAGVDDEVVLSATHENSSITWEILGNIVSQEHSLNLIRADSDVDVSISIEISATIIIPPVNPLPSIILAIMGFGTLILAIALGFSVRTRDDIGQN
ncbi:MAG: hypothetical protein ACXABV_03885 [Candidatus Thorarchaeota archaeon]|jgi:hypothetical protein